MFIYFFMTASSRDEHFNVKTKFNGLPWQYLKISYLDMRHPVIVEIRASGKPLAADLTLVRLFTRMDPSVRVQRTARTEAFVTHRTHVRFFS